MEIEHASPSEASSSDVVDMTTAQRRMAPLLRHLLSPTSLQLHGSSTSSVDSSFSNLEDNYTSITLGDLSVKVDNPERPELVPMLSQAKEYGYHLDLPELLHHLHWMLKKLQLGQDMFLIGPPGPVRRWLAFRFCQLLKREVEFLALTSDTTESDLKQRREIRNRTIHYVDQAAVRAALHGRILILDGIEKCERNVLPILNNLLENREMHLEDGRFLVSPKRYEYLKKINSEEQVQRLNLVPVSPKFQVIALGLPIPKFEGNALDPPLRSRFQARNIPPLSEETLVSLLKTKFPSFEIKEILKLVAFAESLSRIQLGDQSALLPRLLHLPPTAIVDTVKVLNTYPNTSRLGALMRVYPFHSKSNEAERKAIEASLHSIGLLAASTTPESSKAQTGYIPDSSYRLIDIAPVNEKARHWRVRFVSNPVKMQQPNLSSNVEVDIYGGSTKNISVVRRHEYVETEASRQILVSMLQDHSLGFDMCIVGEQGSGKSQLVSKFAELLHYNVRTMQLYKDMTARDLLQKRTTNASGDTVWLPSPLVQAAIHGDIVVLDGIHRLSHGTLCIIQQLIHDRDTMLADGTRLVCRETFETLASMMARKIPGAHHQNTKMQMARDKLREEGVFVVHKAFRIIAVSNPPDKQKQWLNSEIISMFHFHLLDSISLKTKFEIVEILFPHMKGMFIQDIERQSQKSIMSGSSFSLQKLSGRNDMVEEASKKLLSFVSGLNDLRNRKMDTDESGVSDSDVPIFSLRQLIRTCHRIGTYPEDLQKVIENVLLFKFFPLALKESVADVMKNSGILPSNSHPQSATLSERQGGEYSDIVKSTNSVRIELTESTLRIGKVEAKRNQPINPALVPRIAFFEIPSHSALLQDMLKDWTLGEHMLLIGNQGVGKNVLVDRLLELLRLEREYIQLHRDTTVQTLTLSPSIHNGIVVWEDSALVRAVTHGRILVIDEADKAPLEVVCILKGLIEDNEMLLADGRRIVGLKKGQAIPSNQQMIIPIHPSFRMVVLANRPGYPFLGNNFFRECGDCFSVHVVDNPDRDSEIKLLQSYGPHVDRDIIDRLVTLFGDLREMVDQGQLTYPYSLRELVNIVKHMEAYPNDSLLQGIDNVFHFDQYDMVLKEHLSGVFQRHGIPMGTFFDFKVSLAPELPLPDPVVTELWSISTSNVLTSNGSKHGKSQTFELVKKGEWKSPTGSLNAEFKLRRPPTSRIKNFTEEKVSFVVESNGTLEGVTAGLDGTIFVLTTKPLQILAYNPQQGYRNYRVIRLSDHLQTHHPRYQTDRGVGLMPTSITTLKNGHILVLVASFHMLLLLDPANDTIYPIELPSSTNHFSVFGRRAYVTDHVLQALSNSPSSITSSTIRLAMVDSLALTEGLVVFPRLRGADFYWVDFALNKVGHSVLPIQMQIISLHLLTRTVWILVGHNNTRIILKWSSDQLEDYEIIETNHTIPDDFKLGALNQHTFFSTNTRDLSYLGHELTHIQFSDRPITCLAQNKTSELFSPNLAISSVIRPNDDFKTTVHTLHLKKAEHIVNLCFLPPPDLSVDSMRNKGLTSRSIVDDEPRMVLELIDLPTKKARNITITSEGKERINVQNKDVPSSSAGHAAGYMGYLPKVVRIVSIVEMPSGEICALGDDGRISIWEIDPKRLDTQLKQWNRIVGKTNQQQLQQNRSKDELRLTFMYNDGKRASGNPKFGEFDGKMHVGNSTFAGGMGGADTAGMGGSGGPSRLDMGTGPIFQVSDQVKQQVDRSVLEAARAMAKKALEEKLQSIEMSDFDASRYDQMLVEMKTEILQLRSILEAAQAKGKERTWLKLKTQGELDDNRLVDGITGEKSVYKARGKQKPLDGSPQEKPKRLRFVMDVSGSMARFNGTDKRLERLLQCTLMIMESLKGFEHKFSYSIVGHSGDSPEIDFVDYNKPPKNKKERLAILDKMTAHAAHCSSGDYTVKATEMAIRNVVKEEADEHFVFVFSDANLGRYGIRPSQLKEELLRDKRVGAYILFIASAGDDAQRIRTELPLGKAYVCLDTASLPTTFKQIFASNAIQNE